MSELNRTLGRIESHLTALDSNVTQINKSIHRLEKRVSRIEHQQFFWKGGIGTLLMLATLAGSLADHFLMKVLRGTS